MQTCIFCCATWKQTCQDANWSGGSLRIFLRLLDKFLGNKEEDLFRIEISSLRCCEKCVASLEEFSELYRKLEKIQLELKWKLTKLVEVVEGTGKMPRKMKALRMSLQGEEGRWEVVKGLRTRLMTKCRGKLKKEPEVALETVMGLSRSESRTVHPDNSPDEQDVMNSLGDEDGDSFNNQFLMDDFGEDGNDLDEQEEKYCPNVNRMAEDVKVFTSSTPNQIVTTPDCDSPNATVARTSGRIKKAQNYNENSEVNQSREEDFELNSKISKKRPVSLATSIPDKRLVCMLCPKTFTLIKCNLIRHYKVDHSMTASDAYKTFYTQYPQAQHFRNAKKVDETEPTSSPILEGKTETPAPPSGKYYPCRYCSAQFTCRLKLARHTKNSHSGVQLQDEDDTITVTAQVVKCPYCPDYVFKYKKALDNHLLKVHQNQLPSTAENLDARSNFSSTSSSSIFSCSHCPRKFIMKQTLLKHVKIRHSKRHTRTRQHTKKKKSLEEKMTAMNKKVKDPSRYIYTCPHCPQRFTVRCNMQRHIRNNHDQVDIIPISSSNDNPNTDDNEYMDPKQIIPLVVRDKYLCPLCSKVLCIKGNVVKHLRFVHHLSLEEAKITFDTQAKKVPKDTTPASDKPFKCSECGKGFVSPLKRREHQKKFHQNLPSTSSINEDADSNSLSCPICSRQFKFRGMLNIHLQRYHQRQLVTKSTYPTPSFTTSRENILAKTISSFSCDEPECPETFELEEELGAHKLLHGQFSCQFCEQSVTYAPDLAVHEFEKHGVRQSNGKFRCPRCPSYETGSHSSYMYHHVKIHLKLSMKVMRCALCLAAFIHKDTAKGEHWITHHAVEKVDPATVKRCDVCPAYFLKHSQLMLHKWTVHEKRIMGDKSKCRFCGKQFRLRQTMKQHVTLFHKYDDECMKLPLPCDLKGCRKRFETQDELDWHQAFDKHVGINKNEDEMICQDCGKKCKGTLGLKVHQLSHNPPKEKELVCDKCGQGFTTQGALDKHCLTKHQPAKLQCTECGTMWKTEGDLRRHARKVHG